MTPSVGIVGATGAVGMEMIRCLEASSLGTGRVRLFSSVRSAGRSLEVAGAPVTVEDAARASFEGLGLVLMAAGAAVSRALAPRIAAGGALVIDNSSAFRLEKDVPLVIPELNAGRARRRGIVASPNCSTIVALLAAGPLHRAFGVRRIVAATYQAVSGIGAAGWPELEAATRAALDGAPFRPRAFSDDIAFNVIPRVGEADESGATDEETKMRNEARKILDAPDLEVSCTCVRVPVARTHGIALDVTLERRPDGDPAAAARRVLAAAPGVRLADHATPRFTEGDDVVVARLRRSSADGKCLAFFALGDQLRRGAALNAVRIAEHVFS